MHIDTKEINAYLERQARKANKNLDKANPFASKYGIALAVIWMLIMDLDPDVRAKHIKQMKVKA